MIVTLTQAKDHLRVDQSTEDTLITLYIQAAEDWISNFLNTPNIPYTHSVKAAALLIIGDLYENREGASEKEIKENPAVVRLLYPYREGLGI